jgi:hypothetical protein
MALIGRIFVVLFSFLLASLAAAMAMAAGMMLPYEWQNMGSFDIHRGLFSVTVGFGFFFISWIALLPAMVVIAIAEAFRLRSVLFYAAAGGIEGFALYHGVGISERMSEGALATRMAEIMTAAGIAGGLCYWVLAGRNAGRWSEPRSTAATQSHSAAGSQPPK